MTPVRAAALFAPLLLALGSFETAYSGDELQEVVVSAQKREESINKVPISVAVLGRDEMEKRSIKDFADVAAVAPGVDFQKEGTFIDGAGGTRRCTR